MIRLQIIGDIRLYRDGVAQQLGTDPRFVVMGVASTSVEACHQVGEEQPDVVVIDMAMRDSLALVRDLTRLAPNTRIVALTVPEIEPAIITCVEAGVAGYVSRGGTLEDLVNAVTSAAAGEVIVSPKMAGGLVRRLRSLAADREATPPSPALTAREAEIAGLIDEGLSNKQIGARLNIELATVKNHVHNLLEKLQVHRRGEATRRLRSAALASGAPAVAFERDELRL